MSDNQKVRDLHFFTNKYARERVDIVVDEINALLITDETIGAPELKHLIDRELALAFLKGVQMGEGWSKSAIIEPKKPRLIT